MEASNQEDRAAITSAAGLAVKADELSCLRILEVLTRAA